METLTCQEILQAVNGILLSGDINTVFGNVCTDSRSVKEGDIFVPLVGEKFDGHDYILSSLEKGALGSLTQKDTEISSDRVLIKVPDTLKALRDLAAYYRQKSVFPL